MTSVSLVACLLGSLLLGWTSAALAAFAHPGLLNNAAELTFMKTQVDAATQPWKRFYDNLPDASAYTPRAHNPLVVDPPATISATSRYTEIRWDCERAYASMLQWKVTGSTARATKAIQILNNFTTITSGSGTDLPLRLGIETTGCLEAAEILKHVYGGWASNEITAFSNWLSSFVWPRLPPLSRINWAPSGARARMMIGVFQDNQARFDQGLNEMRTIIRDQIRSPGIFIQTCRAGGSSGWVTSGGDLNHVASVLHGMIWSAEIAKHQGIDLYGYKDPADNMGLEDMLLYHDQWYGFHDNRPGSSSAGWPCGTPLSQINTDPSGAWNGYANHYGDASFHALADWCNATAAANSTRCQNAWFFPWHALTHRYNQGGGAAPDTSPPTAPTLALAP